MKSNPKQAKDRRLDRASLLVLVFAILFLVYQVIPEILAYTLPTDGWTMDMETAGADSSIYQVFLKTYLLNTSNQLQTGDQVLAVEGRSAQELIAAIFEPARRRIQSIIDRRFFRQKYDAALTLERFARAARQVVGLDNLTTTLVGVVEKTVQPDAISMWLRKEQR